MTLHLLPPPVKQRWKNEIVVVAATGPSLTKEVAEMCKGQKCIAVSDAYKLFPFAEVLYSCDPKWWHHHKGCPEFEGEKWSCHGAARRDGKSQDDKTEIFQAYAVHIVMGTRGNVTDLVEDSDGIGFSTDPRFIHYGMKGANSGFQACNLAILFGAKRVVMVGFDMQQVGSKAHFFGDHPDGFTKQSPYTEFIKAFEDASKRMPDHVEIINATPSSALTCFEYQPLDQALKRK